MLQKLVASICSVCNQEPQIFEVALLSKLQPSGRRSGFALFIKLDRRLFFFLQLQTRPRLEENWSQVGKPLSCAQASAQLDEVRSCRRLSSTRLVACETAVHLARPLDVTAHTN